MLLQRILCPAPTDNCSELYMHKNMQNTDSVCRNSLQSTYDRLNFNTYFNMLSIAKWEKYTLLQRVSLQLNIEGRAQILLTALFSCDNRPEETIVKTEIVHSDIRSNFIISYPEVQNAVAYGFYLNPLSDDFIFHGGAYTTDVPESSLSPVDLALAICTYKREDYINNNMQMLQKDIFDKKDSLLHGHVKVFIADNGKTLDPEKYDPNFIKVFPNKNSGGSGGFSRAAIEALHDNDFHPTHIILMDDDITFNTETLERTYTFLRLLKPEYKNAMLGGTMFRSDTPCILHAAGESLTLEGIQNRKIGLDMQDIKNVLLNELDEQADYLGWWYCCIPVSQFGKTGFSLPLFVQYDDIEYGLRNTNITKITLNGICCWHIPFDKKWSASKSYYEIRNRSIVKSIYFPSFTRRYFVKGIRRECIQKFFQYSYKEAEIILAGAEDFLKGLSWLSQQDPERLNQNIINRCDRLTDLDQLPIHFDAAVLQQSAQLDQSAIGRIKRILTLNGWLLPANRETAAEINDLARQHYYRAKRVLRYDRNSGKGYVAEKSYKKAFSVLKKYILFSFNTVLRFNQVSRENKKLLESITCETFWTLYLE